MSKIIEVFGQFAVDLGNGAELFKVKADAEAALAEFEHGAVQRDQASAYCAFKSSEATTAAKKSSYKGKAAQGKVNVIVSFLAWVESGSPAAVVEEVVNPAVELVEVASEGSPDLSTFFGCRAKG